MRILVTGASGFLGRHVCAKAMEAGHHTTAMVRRASGIPINQTIACCDLTDADSVREALCGGDYQWVIHLAGSRGSAGEMRRVNVQGTVNLLESLPESVRHLTLAGSCAIYGVPDDPEGLTPEDHPAKPVTEYGMSMLEKELTAGRMCRERGISFASARIFNLFGPGQQETMMTSAIASKLVSIFMGMTEPPLKTGPLHTFRDQIDAADAAQALLEMTEAEADQPLNVGTGHAVSGRTIVDEMQAILGSDIPVLEEIDRSPMVQTIKADTARIRKLLGWEAKIPRATTLENIIEDYMSRN